MHALVVDDSRSTRRIISKMIREMHINTTEATNGIEAMAILESGPPPDFVTINWHMPEMDGLELVMEIRRRQKFRQIPLLMISGEADDSKVAQAMSSGISAYIIKPCTPKQISSHLHQLGLKLPEVLPQPTLTKRTAASNRPIRVMVVDDSSLVRRVVSETLDRSKEIEVVGGAANGQQALDKIPALKPDAILLDVEMPVMDGLETLRQMRQKRIDLPVVMFSSRTERGAKIATEALLLGARDFVFKPGGTEMSDLAKGRQAIQDEAIPKLIAVTRKGSPRFTPPSRPDRPLNRVDLVVVGASTGGPAAIAKILQTQGLAQSLHAPILIVQHMPEHFTAHLASRLKQETSLDIAEAEEGEVLQRGMIRIAPGGVRHTCVNGSSRKLTVFLREDPPVNSCRPSVDVLFHSAADCIGANSLGVMLTGMGQDGVNGCRKIVETGGHVLAQDEASSIVWGMPGNVVAQHLEDKVVPLDLLGAEITRRLNHGR